MDKSALLAAYNEAEELADGEAVDAYIKLSGAVRKYLQIPVTVYELACHRLDRVATNGADFDEAGLPIMGGCGVCGATVAAYNSCPSKSGVLKCANECIGDDGWTDVVEANNAIFGQEG